jgi:DNA (cytosine-5)-methyltransferase 1
MKELSFIDVFAGASGMSEGFIQAEFKPIAHIEMNLEACNTIVTRTAYHHLKEVGQLKHYENYLKKKITRQELLATLPIELIDSVMNYEISDESIDEIFTKLEPKVSGPVDLLIGGPPCQAYSLLGRHRVDVKNDPRNYLFIQYGKFLQKYKPKAFVFENVPGLLTANNGKYFEDLKSHFKSLGYKVNYKILDASDYGVLQYRKRVIIIGWQNKLDLGFPDLDIKKSELSINDLFIDLPKLRPGESLEIANYSKKSDLSYGDTSIQSEFNFATQHISRPHNQRDLSIYKLVIEKWNKDRSRMKYTDIPISLRTHNNLNSFLDRFKVVDGKSYSHTVVAHIAKDGHHYIHPDIEQCRSISVREAARIQSFPDNYFFEGPRTAAFTQIGNAVPPLLAYAIASKMRDLL